MRTAIIFDCEFADTQVGSILGRKEERRDLCRGCVGRMGEKKNLFSIFCPPLSLLIRHTFPFSSVAKDFFSFSKRETKTADLIDLWAGCGTGFDKVEAFILTVIISPRNKKNIKI